MKTSAITNQRRFAADLKPTLKVNRLIVGTDKSDFVVAAQADRFAFRLKRQQAIDCASAVGTSIYVVAEKDEPVLRSRLDDIDQGVQSGTATMNVSYDDGSHAI